MKCPECSGSGNEGGFQTVLPCPCCRGKKEVTAEDARYFREHKLRDKVRDYKRQRDRHIAAATRLDGLVRKLEKELADIVEKELAERAVKKRV